MAGKRYYWLKLQVGFFQELIMLIGRQKCENIIKEPSTGKSLMLG